MYNLPALFLACCSLLAPATAKPVVHAVAPVRPAPRDAQLYSHHTKRAMVKRDANTTFDMSFEAKNVTLFSGFAFFVFPFPFPSTYSVPLPCNNHFSTNGQLTHPHSDWLNLGLPFSLDLTCVECRTWGNLVASVEFPEDLGDLLDDLADFNPLNDASLTVAFEGVGALVDLSLTVGDKGSFTIPLFVSQTPLGVAVSRAISLPSLLFFFFLILSKSRKASTNTQTTGPRIPSRHRLQRGPRLQRHGRDHDRDRLPGHHPRRLFFYHAFGPYHRQHRQIVSFN